MAEKRKRQRNFVPDEKMLLLNIVHKYKDVILNKKTDQTTWKEKEVVWKKIEIEFNSSSTTCKFVLNVLIFLMSETNIF